MQGHHSSTFMQWFTRQEIPVCLAFNRASQQPGIRPFFALISRLGDGIFWYALTLLLPFIYPETGLDSALHMVATGLITVVIYKILKRLTGRPRPCAASKSIVLGTAPLDQFSFPSGHTMHAVAFTLTASHFHPELIDLLLPFTALVALSRLILGLHYPSDVLFGGLIGGALASLVIGF